MQFPISALIASVVIATASAQNGNYIHSPSTDLSYCVQGDDVFCGGIEPVCPDGQTATYDATVNQANVDACKGIEVNGIAGYCTQTVLCVPS
ncbi:uncharacterized protein ColSpa_01995 [Colletotrichum spaethianum]|uniref:Uncharacterized protein n=1 Tax=Colletotrichum spaethianum TaxID=700344 RepID=A0AA37L719_9PEZI|nr:uncharacterized protein ColSpa_01995 [Colletotrichum spaethianum]GKT41814.1 hypothetical protein ColSpa_01995 [Colletotrichum spaethianum]